MREMMVVCFLLVLTACQPDDPARDTGAEESFGPSEAHQRAIEQARGVEDQVQQGFERMQRAIDETETEADRSGG